ncbi:MAG: GspH/FimT family pseudopilin [Xanthomonadales bacterium]|nr:GspH/FimT family pseudopilin [Xanthomonadales bacterium]
MSRQRGFSLIELAVTLVVLAILVAMAGPSMSEFLRKNRVAATTNGLIQAANYARAEALRSGYPVTLCATADASAAKPACLASTSWGSNALVAVQTDGTLLQAFDVGAGNVALTAPLNTLVFNPNGSVSNLAAAGKFKVVPTGCHGTDARELGISRLGRINSKAVSCS